MTIREASRIGEGQSNGRLLVLALCWWRAVVTAPDEMKLDIRASRSYTTDRMKILDVPQSGSVGARTSSRNRSGQYVRQRAIPTQPRTVAQIAARSRLTSQSAAWRGLTAAQRAAWNAFGLSFTVNNSLGTAIHLTGAQCYIKVNTVNLLNGDSTVTSPPALPSFVAVTVTSVDGTAGTQLLEAVGANPASGTKFMWFVSPQVSAGVTFNGVFAWVLTAQVFTATKLALTTVYTAKYGALVAGKQVFVKVVQSQAGMQDNGTIFSCIIGA